MDYTVGLHPTSVEEAWEADLESMPAAMDWAPGPVGLGEMGLDRFHLPKAPDEAARIYARQRAAFAAQLEIWPWGPHCPW